ncbi:MAG: poly-gamma-glutamate biosynthesis protein PgsC/CapC [Acidiferrobacterales bacterium]|nr:poly-gamma-glutamate biosynthesis protein PgsC/CapC [Acidiferrobacterales bacterium]
MLEGLLPIALFPTGGLASSVIVPVWIGVLVVAFFNLRFGWVLSGLVVPGYLVPMLIVNPTLALVNYIEALITLALAMLVSNRLTVWTNLSHFFGRDRFFLIVLISVMVRLVLDTWGFDALSNVIEAQTGESITFRNDLHSFGLIIIALMANQMWKTGLVRGSWHLFVTVGITLILVRYGLMTLTNFSLTNLAFVYEEVSVAILASPKSYIILLVSCYVASRMNLRYGWEYAGILVPSLLAIQWYQPLKILATFAETFVVLAAASLLLRNRWLANMDITGARKLMLFFTVSFVYKFILALSMGVIAPYEKVSDYFAFGYLLSTLIAIKMHDKNLMIGMSRTVLQSSLSALAIATLIGFGLFKIVPVASQAFTPAQLQSSTPIDRTIDSDYDLFTWLVERKSQARESQEQALEPGSGRSLRDISSFRESINLLIDFKSNDDEGDLQRAQTLLAKMGASLQLIEGQFLTISHPNDATFGNYIINLNAEANELLVQAPNALAESDAYNAALSLFKLSNAAYLAISNGLLVSGATDLTNSNALFSHFQMVTAKNEVVQIRTTSRDIDDRAQRWSRGRSLQAGDAYAWVKRALPTGLNLRVLSELVPELSINWFSPNFTNRQRELSNRAFIELLLDRVATTKLLTLAQLADDTPLLEEGQLSIQGYLQQWLFDKKLQIAEKHSDVYQKPSLGEMLFMLDEVIAETLQVIEFEYQDNKWTELGQNKLGQINRLLSIFNYQLVQYRDLSSQETFIVLSEVFGDHAPRYWGTYVFRLQSNSNHIIEVPRPLFERRTFEFGLHAFQNMRAKALFIAGSHPQTNVDLSSDLLKLRNRRSLFSTMHYGVARYYADFPLHFIQVRSMTARQQIELPDSDVLLNRSHSFNASDDALMKHFVSQGLTVSTGQQNLAEGDHLVSELSLNSQTAQLRYQSNNAFSIAWISPETRARFRQSDRLAYIRNQLELLGVPFQELELSSYIDKKELTESTLDEQAISLLQGYTSNHNVVLLSNALAHSQLELAAIEDSISSQLFLEVKTDNETVGFVNLNPVNQQRYMAKRLGDNRGQHFVSGRYFWLDLNLRPTD